MRKNMRNMNDVGNQRKRRSQSQAPARHARSAEPDAAGADATFADKKKKTDEPKKIPVIDYSNIVWPNPPAIARIRYQAFYSAQKTLAGRNAKHKKAEMDGPSRGHAAANESGKVLFQLAEPYGLAVDSKNNLYVADQKVGAIFIFNTETREVELIKNKPHAHFVRIIGLAMDDNDRLFVSDPGLHHVLVFDAAHKAEDVITEGMVDPGGWRSTARTGCSMCRHRTGPGAGLRRRQLQTAAQDRHHRT